VPDAGADGHVEGLGAVTVEARVVALGLDRRAGDTDAAVWVATDPDA
jgi:hypothetical protein